MFVNNYKEKYFKYKKKYINLKNMQIGGVDGDLIDLIKKKTPSEEIIQYINEHSDEVTKYNEITEGRRKRNVYPIEIAIDSNAPDDVILKLIKLSPDEAKNFYVIEKAIEEKRSLDIIKELLEKSVSDEISGLPIFEALRQLDKKIINLLLEKYPEGAKIYNSMGELPIYYLVSLNHKSGLDIITELHKIYPEGIKEINKITKRLPIHYSVRDDSCIDTTNFLIKNYPNGIKIQDFNGNLPIHYSSIYIQPITCKFLKENYPESVDIKNYDEKLPIDLAIKKNVSPEIIKMLMPTDPEYVNIKNKYGTLPIDLALEIKSPEIIKMLMPTDPEYVNIKNKYGNLPIDLALDINSPEIIKMLMPTDHEYVNIKDDDDKLPIDYAIEFNNSPEIIKMLMPYDPKLTEKYKKYN